MPCETLYWSCKYSKMDKHIEMYNKRITDFRIMQYLISIKDNQILHKK